jgi:hypothetical protein
MPRWYKQASASSPTPFEAVTDPSLKLTNGTRPHPKLILDNAPQDLRDAVAGDLATRKGFQALGDTAGWIGAGVGIPLLGYAVARMINKRKTLRSEGADPGDLNSFADGGSKVAAFDPNQGPVSDFVDAGKVLWDVGTRGTREVLQTTGKLGDRTNYGSVWQNPYFTASVGAGVPLTAFGLYKLKQYIDKQTEPVSEEEAVLAKAKREYAQALSKQSIKTAAIRACDQLVDGLADELEKKAGSLPWNQRHVTAGYAGLAALLATAAGMTTHNVLNKLDPDRVAAEAAQDAYRRYRSTQKPSVMATIVRPKENLDDVESISDPETLVVGLPSQPKLRSKALDLPRDTFRSLPAPKMAEFQELFAAHGLTPEQFVDGWNELPNFAKVAAFTEAMSDGQGMEKTAGIADTVSSLLSKASPEAMNFRKAFLTDPAFRERIRIAAPDKFADLEAAMQGQIPKSAVGDFMGAETVAQWGSSLNPEASVEGAYRQFQESMKGKSEFDQRQMNEYLKGVGEGKTNAVPGFQGGTDDQRKQQEMIEYENLGKEIARVDAERQQNGGKFANPQIEAEYNKWKEQHAALGAKHGANTPQRTQTGDVMSKVFDFAKNMSPGQWAGIGTALLAAGTGHPIIALLALAAGFVGPQLWDFAKQKITTAMQQSGKPDEAAAAAKVLDQQKQQEQQPKQQATTAEGQVQAAMSKDLQPQQANPLDSLAGAKPQPPDAAAQPPQALTQNLQPQQANALDSWAGSAPATPQVPVTADAAATTPAPPTPAPPTPAPPTPAPQATNAPPALPAAAAPVAAMETAGKAVANIVPGVKRIAAAPPASPPPSAAPKAQSPDLSNPLNKPVLGQ